MMEPLSWTECFKAMNALAGRGRFSWPQPNSGGFNCHPDFTFSDITGGLSWIITAPGDWLLNLEPISTFFELDVPVAGHWFSWIVGVIMFLNILAHILEEVGKRFIKNF